MAKKLIDILSAAAVVRDETNEKANTAERVGGVLVELANYLSAFAPVSNVTVETDGSNVRLVLHIKNEDGTVSTRSVTLPAASTSSAGVLTSELLKALQATDRRETAERQAADEVLLKRIIGKSTASSAYTDPFKYLENFASEKDEDGTITKHAIRVMQDYLLGTLRHSDYRDSFPYIGHMRAHVEGVPIEMWTYVKAWNTGSTNGVFVQVVRTNFGLNNGVISSALTESFHEYFRAVTVGMANGSVTDVTATAWKERTADISDMAEEGISKADAALSQIAEETKERAAADAALQEQIQANEDLAQEGISKAESASAMLFSEEAARKEADLGLNDLIEAEVTERLQSVATEAAARKAADDELRAIADEGLSKADAALSQIHEERQERAAQDRALAEAVSNERAARTSADAELQAKIQDHEDRIWKLENQWYGIEWDTEVSSPAVTRIGNMDLHRTLPIQSRMRGCLLDDNGKVVEYLNEKDWTGHDLSGARGQVMVEIPSHYRRFETDGTKRRVKMSEYPLPGFNFVKMGYLSANEATIQRSTGKLASVVNPDPDFRGGNNQAEFDGTYKSVLGKPANYISLSGARTAARKRGKEGDTQWNCYTYDLHVTLTWLYVVEYANRNSQLPFTAELTAEGFHQGGLGAFSIPTADYKSYFKNVPVIPCGCTHHLGNGSGVVNLHLSTDDGTYERDILVPRYRGVEVPFGHLCILTDGIFWKRTDTSSKWTVYATSDPSVFGSEDTTQYREVGLCPAKTGNINDIHFGEQGDITPSNNIKGSNTTYFCDSIYTVESVYSPILLGGRINFESTNMNGLFFVGDYFNSYRVVTRLCFLPAE